MSGRTKLSMNLVATLFSIAFASFLSAGADPGERRGARVRTGRFRRPYQHKLAGLPRVDAPRGPHALRARSPYPDGDNSDAYLRKAAAVHAYKISHRDPTRNKRANAKERAACADAVRLAHARCHLGRRGIR